VTTDHVGAPAKLTLSLRVTGVRDDGYHLIDAEMVTLALDDELTIERGGSGLSVGGPFAAGVPVDASNLVARALVLAGVEAAVHVDKRIPHGGGLGGGSADAAAVLRWAGYDDLVGASRLGADIPFCLVGGRARVRGIGEIVEPLPFQQLDITLVVPPFGVSTPAVYRAWDDMMRAAALPADAINELEAPAVRVEPRLADWRAWIEELVGTPPTLAGSGSTWFLRGHHPQVRALEERGATVVLTRTIGRGPTAR
jgi:4-diphosphocytidyl-2-C-methyl-D-erythritol kinase